MKTINVYEFNELNDEAKENSIIGMINNFYNNIDYENLSLAMQKVVDGNERTKTPWFTPEGFYFDCRDEIIEDIKANKYHFTEKGEFI